MVVVDLFHWSVCSTQCRGKLLLSRSQRRLDDNVDVHGTSFPRPFTLRPSSARQGPCSAPSEDRCCVFRKRAFLRSNTWLSDHQPSGTPPTCAPRHIWFVGRRTQEAEGGSEFRRARSPQEDAKWNNRCRLRCHSCGRCHSCSCH